MTPNAYNYNNFNKRIDDQTSVVFRVQACNDAHVVLFDKHQTNVAYEIVIGGSSNEWTYIRRAKLTENKASVCSEYTF